MTLDDLVHTLAPERWAVLVESAHREGLPDMARIDLAVARERALLVGTADYGMCLVRDADGRCRVCGEPERLPHIIDCPYEHEGG